MAMAVITTAESARPSSEAVSVSIACRPEMSPAMRDCTSPVRVPVKKRSDRLCRCA